mgnify:FL=1|jgi:hypothetical protein
MFRLVNLREPSGTRNRRFSVIDLLRFFGLNYTATRHLECLGFSSDHASISDHGVRANPDLTRLNGIELSIDETPWTLVSVPTRNLSKSAKPVVTILSM